MALTTPFSGAKGILGQILLKIWLGFSIFASIILTYLPIVLKLKRKSSVI